jgi:hypothetical protein
VGKNACLLMYGICFSAYSKCYESELHSQCSDWLGLDDSSFRILVLVGLRMFCSCCTDELRAYLASYPMGAGGGGGGLILGLKA